MDIQGYVNEIRSLHASGQTTEHSFRPALSRLFNAIDPDVTVINEPRRVAVGAPDFVFDRKGISIGWVEAKDIGKDVRKFATGDYSREQKARYTKGLPNLIYTNGLDFEFIRLGESVAFVTIADLIPTLPARPENFPQLESLLRDFARETPVSIRTARQLAEMMAGKAAIIKDIMGRALVADMDAGNATELTGQYEAFKANLIHEITVAEFADIYAETIAYGLFAARLHDTTMDSFSRVEALDLLPRSNPFLRSLFGYIAGVDLDDRIRWVIDELCDVFRAADLHHILRDFGKFTARNDPFLHFYETFLAEYNPSKRKARGVWYTPEPVVNFIVRAVDDVLKTEFGLADGLADTSRVTIDWDTGQTDAKGKPVTIPKDVHRVQVLDPATGTGTFLAEVIKLVADRVKGIAPGQWSNYVETDLIPRLHGFELLMASYAMCHMKLDMILTELGYKPTGNPPRLGVYLTNSLEEGEKVEQNLFAQWLANEAKQASDVKRQTPIMCVIGNPPYSGHSSNKGPWIEGLMADYKVSPELKRPAQAKWLSDDYVKFIRFAEHMIEKNGEGVLGFITNHGYLDNPTFLDMRSHLRQTFDRLYVLDLHGNAKKKEVSPDGSPDKNVFDIQQGVAIIVAVKRRETGQAKQPATVLHGELWGDREHKYQALWAGSHFDLAAQDVSPDAAPWRFKPTDKALESAYLAGFSVADLFSANGRPAPGIVTTHDEFAISWTAAEAVQKVERLLTTANEAEARGLFRLCSQSQWNYSSAKVALADGAWRSAVTPISYRPFDTRFTVYNAHVAVHRRDRVMGHFFGRHNLGLATARSNKNPMPDHFFVTDLISETKYAESSTQSVNIPLYIHPDEQDLDQTIRLNVEPRLYAQICKEAGLTGPLVAPDGSGAFRRASGAARPDEVKVFDYIYGVLHCPAYRETYREFLKVDFPRVPFPRDPATFARISAQGEALRRLHLMEPAAIGDAHFPFEGDGDSVVDKPRLEGGKVWINAAQGFAGVSDTAWNFHIGGYQPAQKWLKDRKGRALSWDDIRHYQRIIKILGETDRIMQQIEVPLD
ncbi:type ISP restriction/modification enzyme [Novosphingobium sp.]|uniref:type ISP restriction/modification enzyme n=1 Tax=Novosphingobium sp. TaxID=1874826 RepID=UPI002736A7BD|nr:type ISP restriction/modification enzyme [Novosphingobium sp.]MDP3908233.1 type ISP restriction/modification enzyme [Novosphingobium sp.]